MDERHKTHAKIAFQSYVPRSRRKEELDGYIYQPEESHKKRVVYYHPEKDHYIIGYRGTNWKDKADVEDNTRIATGRLHTSPRHQAESDYLENYKDKNVHLTGHSMGAAHSHALSHKHGHKSIAFSMPGMVEHFKDDLRTHFKKDKTRINYTTDKDKLGLTHMFSKRIKTKLKDNPHGLENFMK